MGRTTAVVDAPYRVASPLHVGGPLFIALTTIAMVETSVQKGGETATERRFRIFSAALDSARS